MTFVVFFVKLSASLSSDFTNLMIIFPSSLYSFKRSFDVYVLCLVASGSAVGQSDYSHSGCCCHTFHIFQEFTEHVFDVVVHANYYFASNSKIENHPQIVVYFSSAYGQWCCFPKFLLKHIDNVVGYAAISM